MKDQHRPWHMYCSITRAPDPYILSTVIIARADMHGFGQETKQNRHRIWTEHVLVGEICAMTPYRIVGPYLCETVSNPVHTYSLTHSPSSLTSHQDSARATLRRSCREPAPPPASVPAFRAGRAWSRRMPPRERGAPCAPGASSGPLA